MTTITFDPKPYIEEIKKSDVAKSLITTFDYSLESMSGSITYNPQAVNVDPDAPDFNGTTTSLNPEELVRVCTLIRLGEELGYPIDSSHIDLEKCYEAPGRPKKNVKGSRADIIVRDDEGAPFLYIEVKTPYNYISQQNFIEGQLFQSSKLETIKPTYLVWSTVRYRGSGRGHIDALVIPTETYPVYDEWVEEGSPAGNSIPKAYGCSIKKQYANVDVGNESFFALDESSDEVYFASLVENLHNVIWGGGGTSSNEVFAILTKLFLCKIYDEKETLPGAVYEFQVKYSSTKPEDPKQLMLRMNKLYKKAEKSYLGIKSDNSAFDSGRIKPTKILYVVNEIEKISLTRNMYDGDLLGSFFEAVVSHGFTQTKGQFFTPPKLIDSMISLADCTSQAKEILMSHPDGRGVHRLPNVIDPSCGVGSFLVMYMKRITRDLANDNFRNELSDRAKEAFDRAFTGCNQSNWARESLYGIENNYDLGLAAKVNMILHGDGSMNTWVSSGLLPFSSYAIEGRGSSFLGQTTDESGVKNETFDLVLSNPPFSISLTKDDKKEIEGAFSGELGLSEELFIERWYQLLKPGTGRFCCVLPESICDTSSEKRTRMYILLRFKILAVVSLPYLAFQPYTSVKTCILLAEKRTSSEIEDLQEIAKKYDKNLQLLKQALEEAGVLSERIFMAEPQDIGYKRRKGLSDLKTDDELPEVVSRFHVANPEIEPSLRLGFWTTVKDVFNRETLRFDPKYRWLWDIKNGIVTLGMGNE